jgi:hypothetical protein
MLEIEVILELIRTLYNHAHPTFKMNFGWQINPAQPIPTRLGRTFLAFFTSNLSF